MTVADTGGHHIGGDRNVVKGDTGRTGTDIFHAAVQMTRMPMCLVDPHLPDSPLVFVNAAFEQLTGYAAEEILGRNCRFLQGPATDREAVEAIARSLRAQEDVSMEVFNYRKDGTGFWNALFVSPVYDDTGRLVYFFGSQIDVTRRKEAEMLLAQSQRMEALGSMAASVAHEFNNLMTVVMGSLEQARKHANGDRQERHLAQAAWGAERAGRLTQQMLSFSRRQFHDTRPEEANSLVGALDGLVSQAAGSGVAVRFELWPEKLPILVDAGQFDLAVLNLARNAGDAMPDGGELVLETAMRTVEGARFAVVTVTDTGPGMPEEVRQRAAEPFFTTKPRGKGTGLGLSMVQGFAEQSGGRLEIDSAPGHGARLSVVLPWHEEAGAEAGEMVA